MTLAVVVAQTESLWNDVREAADYVRGRLGQAEVALVLGSGLNGFIDILEDKRELSYADIPHMPTTTVKVSGSAVPSHPGARRRQRS